MKVSGVRAFGKDIAFMNGVSAFIKEIPESSQFFFVVVFLRWSFTLVTQDGV